MDVISSPKCAAWQWNVDLRRCHGSNRLQQNKCGIGGLRRPLLMLSLRSCAALVGFCLRPLGRTVAVGSHLVWALTLDAAVHPGFRCRLPACARRDVKTQEGQHDEGGDRAGDHRPQSIAPEVQNRHTGGLRTAWQDSITRVAGICSVMGSKIDFLAMARVLAQRPMVDNAGRVARHGRR